MQSTTLAVLTARVQHRGVSASYGAERGLAATYGVVSRVEWDYSLHLKAAPTLAASKEVGMVMSVGVTELLRCGGGDRPASNLY
jgi:hypothetical protein